MDGVTSPLGMAAAAAQRFEDLFLASLVAADIKSA